MKKEKQTIAVILSGCGHQDGAEIHEATLTLLAIHRQGAEYQCYAPNKNQLHVLNHITGEEMDEKRNTLVESARIARGKVKDLGEFTATNHSALIIPGGFGAAKNLSTFFSDGPDCEIDSEVRDAIITTHQAEKPLGALCIAPVILAKIIDNAKITIGDSPQIAEHIETMGGTHFPTSHGEITVDYDNKIVTTPCYMLDARVDQIADGADNLVKEILAMIGLN